MSAEGLYRVLGLDGYVVLDTWQSEADGRLRVLIEAPREALRVGRVGVQPSVFSQRRVAQLYKVRCRAEPLTRGRAWSMAPLTHSCRRFRG